MNAKRISTVLLAALLLLSGCGTVQTSAYTPPVPALPAVAEAAPEPERAVAAPEGSYVAPPFEESEFHRDKAQGRAGAWFDVSAAEYGYIGVSAESDKRLKCLVVCGDETYIYDLPGDGTPSIFPLTCGDGDYSVRIMENVSGTKYAEKAALPFTVKLKSEFAPFIRPSAYVNYTKESECVKIAEGLAVKAKDENDVVLAVYDFICGAIRYDRDKANSVQSGYVSDPDETLRTGKGICLDYAALAAAMLRSQGIPTKMIFGHVSPGDVYHAWNMFYTEKTGWVTVSFVTGSDGWTRMDATFAAGGASAEYIGDGSNYADLYIY